MKFKCCYRTSEGAKHWQDIEAPSRASAFRKARRLGLNVIELGVSPACTLIKSSEPDAMSDAGCHAYILGFLLGPLGFIISACIWKERGMKCSFIGLAMLVVMNILWMMSGIAGACAGIVLAIILESRAAKFEA